MKIPMLLLFGVALIASLINAHRYHGGHGEHHHRGWPPHHHHGGHHGRHHRGVPFVNIEVHEPKGLEVSMIQRDKNVTFFGVEIFVNKNADLNTTCDICQNTTSVTYGKFIILDEEAIIKKGDVLSFYILTGDSSNVTRHHLQKLWVTSSIISKCTCTTPEIVPDIDLRNGDPAETDPRPYPPSESQTEPPFEFSEIESAHGNDLSSEERPLECDLDPATNLCRSSKRGEIKTKNDLQREVQILEEIINQMKNGCPSRRSSNMLRLTDGPLRAGSVDEIKNFLQSSLSVSSELRELVKRIHRVIPSRRDRYIMFEMISYADKQKVLYHAKLNGLKQFVDVDN
ncbi:uncharacterized protein LOC129776305 [Toxorhynchites rutilus septentrionalis]|uniref:uncharacterized protein LOC129776305 n=1 Tax=Toxorhynchites rutilus septentrionalis TaxID=329112 RepID=UPI0024786CA3|nr:uncharacterized protein LOC129776305 [Toxorhynchites rutilus septentrionalis]